MTLAIDHYIDWLNDMIAFMFINLIMVMSKVHTSTYKLTSSMLCYHVVLMCNGSVIYQMEHLLAVFERPINDVFEHL